MLEFTDLGGGGNEQETAEDAIAIVARRAAVVNDSSIDHRAASRGTRGSANLNDVRANRGC